MSDSETLRRERQEDLYWRTVRATLETVFNENPDQIAPMERAYREGPPLDRAVLYNMDPLDLAADFLDVTPTEAQRNAYAVMVAGLRTAGWRPAGRQQAPTAIVGEERILPKAAAIVGVVGAATLVAKFLQTVNGILGFRR